MTSDKLTIDHSGLASHPADLLSEAGMLLPSGKKLVIFVEGESDQRLFQNAFRNNVAIIPAGNCDAVEKIINDYDQRSNLSDLPQIIGIADRDYRIAASQHVKSKNLIYTELRDIECEMIDSAAFENLVSEYCSQKFRNTWADVMTFRKILLNATSDIGKLRLYNHIKKSNISFRQLDISKFYCFKQHKLDSSQLISHIRGAQAKGVKTPPTYKEVTDLANQKDYRKHTSPLRLSRGHDIFNILQLYFQKGFGRNGVNVSAEHLESSIRIGFQPLLKNSPTFKKISDWLQRSGPQNFIR